MTRSTAIQDRVAGAILDAAADLLARGGEPPSMNEVAEGVRNTASIRSLAHSAERAVLRQQALHAVEYRLVQSDIDDLAAALRGLRADTRVPMLKRHQDADHTVQ